MERWLGGRRGRREKGSLRKLCFCTLRFGTLVGSAMGSGVGSTVGLMSLMFVYIRTFVFLLPLLLTMSEFCFCDSESSGFVFFSFLASDVDGECGNASSLGYVV